LAIARPSAPAFRFTRPTWPNRCRSRPLAGGPDYFATYDFTEEWTKGGQTVLMRPYAATG
jgi:hypothetical protein